MSRTWICRSLAAGITAVGAATLAPSASLASSASRSVVVVSSASDLAANGDTTAQLTVRVRAQGAPARDVPVSMGLSGRPGASCGSLGATTGRTNDRGVFRTTYVSSSTVGFCTVGAVVARATASTVVDQTSPSATTPYSVTLRSRSDQSHEDVTLLRVTVESAGAPVPGDPVMATETPTRPGSCGSIVWSTVTTNADGRATATYTAPHETVGRCQIFATEAMSGSVSNTVTVWESGPPR